MSPNNSSGQTRKEVRTRPLLWMTPRLDKGAIRDRTGVLGPSRTEAQAEQTRVLGRQALPEVEGQQGKQELLAVAMVALLVLPAKQGAPEVEQQVQAALAARAEQEAQAVQVARVAKEELQGPAAKGELGEQVLAELLGTEARGAASIVDPSLAMTSPAS